MPRPRRNVRYQADSTAYDQLPEEVKSEKHALVMRAYRRGVLWREARDYCVKRGMTETNFKYHDARLKRLGVIRPVETKFIDEGKGGAVPAGASEIVERIKAVTVPPNPLAAWALLRNLRKRLREGDPTLARLPDRIAEDVEVFGSYTPGPVASAWYEPAKEWELTKDGNLVEHKVDYYLEPETVVGFDKIQELLWTIQDVLSR